MSESPLLAATDIEASYGNIRALHGVSIEVPAGGITTLIGANGAGKTTLLKVLIGALSIESGTVHLKGEDISHWTPRARVHSGVVLVPEGRGIIGELTVEENLQLGLDVRGPERTGSATSAAETLDDIYGRFEVLGDRRHLRAGLLSGGEQQMLALGRALLARPRILMLDEPSLGLAPQIVRDVFGMLSKLREAGMTVVLVEQNAKQALRVADSCYLLENGRVVLEGEPATMREDPRVRAAYVGD